ncbi:uncharacterized protein LOC9656079 [Selaginella moellendorffii]|uniref:uncharacterized protein LOC9656079 n=1 Tax=Selaginella moellendorffii TaxID=88036 RepID=UPI000D1CDA8C|nr:uncharacterized protein LOC9656079 [Selaginella moellendorffii]|eukprot:XP_024517696.1 uncharacterized protein LOC9656079 [Selaginella moellendorffii]
MIQPVRLIKDAYQAEPCGDKYGELQDRPHMSAVFTGIKSIMPASEQIAARESSTKYMEKVRKADGSFEYVEKDAAHESSSKKQNLRWVMDILMFALRGGAWCIDGVATWVPRVIAECKWSLKPEDVYQVSLGGARLFVDRLQKRLPIDRLYLKVWSAKEYRYSILDVFGYVRLRDGRVTPESVSIFEKFPSCEDGVEILFKRRHSRMPPHPFKTWNSCSRSVRWSFKHAFVESDYPPKSSPLLESFI